LMLESPLQILMPDSSNETGLTYADAGVSIAAQDEAIARLARHARSTFRPEVLTDVGLFGAAFSAKFQGIEDPVLISSTDGVGTKLKYHYRFGTHRKAGVDLVATCINDIICAGAEPLFFLDYIACNRVEPAVIEELVAGMSEGCLISGCSLIGGEIAEMRDTYREGEYDLAGFGVGVVSRERMLPSSQVAEGDTIIGIPSSGLHCNGFSLARKVLDRLFEGAWSEVSGELGCSPEVEVTRPCRIYAAEAKALLESGFAKAMAHISGGGLLDNLPRVMPKGLGAVIETGSLPKLAVFHIISESGPVEQREMFRTFNMGIGLAVVVESRLCARCIELLDSISPGARPIGRVCRVPGVQLV